MTRRFETVCVYCGSSDDISEDYLQAARQMAVVLSEHVGRLVFGGGRTGMMGALADAARANGMEVVGIIPKRFDIPALAHEGLDELLVVEDMHARKSRMAEMSDAFIALPGGFGTFDEFFEILTWAQIGIHSKPIGVLNTRGYFDKLFAFIEAVREQGFIYREHRDLFVTHHDPQEMFQRMLTFQTPGNLKKWVQRTEG